MAMFKYINFQGKNSGQVLILTVLILSGTVLAVTTIAGILMVYQIRQTGNVTDSAKAIFAADTGLEWELYKKIKDPDYPKPVFTNRADVETSISEDGQAIKSIGRAGNVRRAFELRLYSIVRRPLKKIADLYYN